MNNMSGELPLPRDPIEAAKLLTELPQKDPALCQYPLCNEFRREPKGGKPAAYCGNKSHNPVTYKRACDKLASIAAGITTDISVSFAPIADAKLVGSFGDVVIKDVRHLNGTIQQFLDAMAEFTNPDMVAIQLQAASDRAMTQIAQSQELASEEERLRRQAEDDRTKAQNEARIARDAAEQARLVMEAIQKRNDELIQETQQKIMDALAERDAAIDKIKQETHIAIEKNKEQSQQKIDIAEAREQEAQKLTKHEESRARQAESHALTQIAVADGKVNEALLNLQRERDEITRLRDEQKKITNEARDRAEADLKEIERLRTNISELTQNASKRAEADLKEIERLRSDISKRTEEARDRAEEDRVILTSEREESKRLRTELKEMREERQKSLEQLQESRDKFDQLEQGNIQRSDELQ